MGKDRFAPSHALLVGAATILTSLMAPAAHSDVGSPSSQEEAIVAAAYDTTANAAPSTQTDSFPSSEAGVRTAAAEGPDALRRYIQRTRMIYNYYYWNFAKER